MRAVEFGKFGKWSYIDSLKLVVRAVECSNHLATDVDILQCILSAIESCEGCILREVECSKGILIAFECGEGCVVSEIECRQLVLGTIEFL